MAKRVRRSDDAAGEMSDAGELDDGGETQPNVEPNDDTAGAADGESQNTTPDVIVVDNVLPMRVPERRQNESVSETERRLAELRGGERNRRFG